MSHCERFYMGKLPSSTWCCSLFVNCKFITLEITDSFAVVFGKLIIETHKRTLYFALSRDWCHLKKRFFVSTAFTKIETKAEKREGWRE